LRPAAERLDRHLSESIKELKKPMATPAAISKLTEHATRAKRLMATTEVAAEVSGPILDNYEATLTRYMAHLARVKQEEKDLAAMMQGMGNATEIIDGAFQNAKPDAAKASVGDEQQKANVGA
jgi:hypothetical protein